MWRAHVPGSMVCAGARGPLRLYARRMHPALPLSIAPTAPQFAGTIKTLMESRSKPYSAIPMLKYSSEVWVCSQRPRMLKRLNNDAQGRGPAWDDGSQGGCAPPGSSAPDRGLLLWDTRLMPLLMALHRQCT